MTAKLTRAELSAVAKANAARRKDDPARYAAWQANVSAAQKKRFAKPKGKTQQMKMQAARWENHEPLSPEHRRLADKLGKCGIRNPRTTLRQMLAAEQACTG